MGENGAWVLPRPGGQANNRTWEPAAGLGPGGPEYFTITDPATGKTELVNGTDPRAHDSSYNPQAWGNAGGGGGVPGGGGAATTAVPPGTATSTATAAASTPWWQSSTIPALINAGIAIKAMHDQKKTPNFYPAPQTPQDAWKEQQTRNLYDFFGKWYEQMIKGNANLNPSWQMPNDNIGNPSFMGGVKVPTFDFSKMGSPTSPAPSDTTPPVTTGTPSASGNTQIEWGAIKPYGSGAMDFAQRLQATGASRDQIMAAVRKVFGGGPPAGSTSTGVTDNPFESAMSA
jgi:hypothetical protein